MLGQACWQRIGLRRQGSLRNKPRRRSNDFRNWPTAAEKDVSSNVGYSGVKRTRSAQSEFFAF